MDFFGALQRDGEGMVIVDTSGIEDEADYGGLLYELKRNDIRDGEAYQIDNADDLIMDDEAYEKGRRVLRRFRVNVIRLS